MSNNELKTAIEEAELVLPDGIGVLLSAKIQGRLFKERVAGIDFAAALISRLAESGGSLFLFGSAPGVAEKAAENIEKGFEGIKILGVNDGYTYDKSELIKKINSLSPDFLLCCLGSPKQELWMLENKAKLRVGIMAGLGGSLDVFSGNIKRAPKLMRKLGLEWLYRIIIEPQRARELGKMFSLIFLVAFRKKKK
ncbi:MAG: WecB/TagA/CpsF family glycosyltransferase [Clostridiales bacterium]|nr:WecB/TagA/CpsF family glycosyltransferase [Clostridiales bacterium]